MLTSLLENNFFSPPGEDHVLPMFNDSLTNRLSDSKSPDHEIFNSAIELRCMIVI
jgi:hypothetical protein